MILPRVLAVHGARRASANTERPHAMLSPPEEHEKGGEVTGVGARVLHAAVREPTGCRQIRQKFGAVRPRATPTTRRPMP